ncbi:hypothetical protein OGATHE_003834 [Ogataea polymorpha]|uniref:Uncharacterized protein n=1 Tax=Ogataea polymorpha TaxID=460523 RepID=A0A9P8P4T0_9ASCO|nr:hypothetical protein OGATHE_003834 [Ogataea polymorpha]
MPMPGTTSPPPPSIFVFLWLFQNLHELDGESTMGSCSLQRERERGHCHSMLRGLLESEENCNDLLRLSVIGHKLTNLDLRLTRSRFNSQGLSSSFKMVSSRIENLDPTMVFWELRHFGSKER